jgi:hypothetical protein
MNGVSMNNSGNDRARVGLFVFSFGVLLGLVLTGLALWGDIEAVLFDASIGATGRISSLRCPVMITSQETGVVRATFSNPADREINLPIIIRISEGRVTLMREIRSFLPLSPGERASFEWEVTPEDAAFDLFVLVRVHTLRMSPLPARTGSCGILVIDIPVLTGNQLFTIILVGSLLSMGTGLRIWWSANPNLVGRKQESGYAMLALLITILIGFLVNFFGFWLLGGVLFLFTLLLIVVTLTRM